MEYNEWKEREIETQRARDQKHPKEEGGEKKDAKNAVESMCKGQVDWKKGNTAVT